MRVSAQSLSARQSDAPICVSGLCSWPRTPAWASTVMWLSANSRRPGSPAGAAGQTADAGADPGDRGQLGLGPAMGGGEVAVGPFLCPLAGLAEPIGIVGQRS